MNVLFCQPALGYGGSERSLLTITEAFFDDAQTAVYMLAGQDGPARAEFEKTVERMWMVDAPKLRKHLGVVPRFLRSFWTVYRQIRDIKKRRSVSLVYVNTLMFPQALLGAFLNGLPCVVHIHEIEARYPRLYYQVSLLLAVLIARRIICPCRYVLEQKRLALRPRLSRKARVVYNSSAFDVGPAERSIDGTVRLLTIAGIDRRKGIGDLVPFAKQLTEMLGQRSYTLQIVGEISDSAFHDRVRRELADANLTDSVTFCGVHGDIGPFYRDAHILIHPTHADTFPLALVEAANFSLPAITTDSGGCAEAIEDGETGFVVAVGDTEAMAERVTRLVREPDLYRRMAKNAYRRYLDTFTPPRMIEQIRGVLDEAATESGKSSIKRS
ncbi:MAG: glycosyltransferase family 4 protein [Candidatus Latescibacterota bacterium]|nr:MAG: glycosyltransferase family 4 protein [Candidatus Latescibacterota bacterium]